MPLCLLPKCHRWVRGAIWASWGGPVCHLGATAENVEVSWQSWLLFLTNLTIRGDFSKPQHTELPTWAKQMFSCFIVIVHYRHRCTLRMPPLVWEFITARLIWKWCCIANPQAHILHLLWKQLHWLHNGCLCLKVPSNSKSSAVKITIPLTELWSCLSRRLIMQIGNAARQKANPVLLALQPLVPCLQPTAAGSTQWLAHLLVSCSLCQLCEFEHRIICRAISTLCKIGVCSEINQQSQRPLPFLLTEQHVRPSIPLMWATWLTFPVVIIAAEFFLEILMSYCFHITSKRVWAEMWGGAAVMWPPAALLYCMIMPGVKKMNGKEKVCPS